MCWQPRNLSIKDNERNLLRCQYFKGLEVARPIATSNKTGDIHRFRGQTSDDCYKCTVEQIKPVLVSTYLAGQLENGALKAFGGKWDVSSQIMYANMLLIVGFCLDKKIAEKEDTTTTAEWAWKTHQKYAVTAIHNCGSRYILATPDWATLYKRATGDPHVGL